jgi:hypothetical protein
MNMAHLRQRVCFFVALRPFQVTPTWPNWQSFGGVSPLRDLSFCNGAVWVNGKEAVILRRRQPDLAVRPLQEEG